MPDRRITAATSSLHLLGSLSFERDRIRNGYGSGNRMIPTASQNNKRKQIPLLDSDFHRNVSSFGRKTLMSLGRHIYFSYLPVRQAVNENAEYATSHFLPEYRGQDKEFKAAAETMLYDHDKWCDVAGPPYNMRVYRRSLVKCCAVDGDVGTVYVRDEETGLPYLQVIPGHRIKSDGYSQTVEGGNYDGAAIIDGVIVDSNMNPLAYRVWVGDMTRPDDYIDVPASSMALHFIPHFPGQIRGISEIGLAAWDCQDLSESNRFELLAQKAGAGRVFVERNEDGEPLPGSDYLTAPTSGANGASTPSGLWYETIDQGINTYFKAGSGSALEAVRFDRPTGNQQAFASARLREIIGALGSAYDFVVDLTRIGGHASRVLLEKINRNLITTQDLVVEPAVRRFDGYRLASFMGLGIIPETADWYNFEYQGPAQWTGDRKHDSDVDAQEIRIGVKTRSKSAAQRGESLYDVRAIKEAEAADLFERAKRLSERFDVPFELALSKLEDDGNMKAIEADKEEDDDGGAEPQSTAMETE